MADSAAAGAAVQADLSTGQLAFLFGFIYITVAYIYSEVLHYSKPKIAPKLSSVDTINGNGAIDEEKALIDKGDQPKEHTTPSKERPPTGNEGVVEILFKLLKLDDSFLVKHRLTLRAMVEFGAIMVLFIVTDRTAVFGETKRSYNRDLFMFLYALLVIAAALASARHDVGGGKKIDYLNRHQTEEWKGWMQVLFLMYHYFAAKELYNAIRIFIACYVWMTGFGNFSYYYIRKDFSLGRFCQMMWRLNFLVFFCCVVLRNDYMLYYICPMHTLFTLMVYATCRILPHSNDNSIIISIKFAICVAVVIVIWEVPGIFDAIWGPFAFLVGYQDPRRPNDDYLYEWRFRSGLDRYIWIFGMLCAYCHPLIERFLERLEEMEMKKKMIIRGGIIASCTGAGLFWYFTFFKMDKFHYNQWHPYTSWIPITAYIGLRNFLPPFRHWSLALFAWLGKITLETYICQFHIWLRSDIPNGQPVALLSLLPSNYPLMNFLLTSAIYITVSLRLFNLTNTLRVAFVPSKDNAKLGQNALIGSVALIALYGATLAFVKLPAQFLK